jgi:hypothetical protein
MAADGALAGDAGRSAAPPHRPLPGWNGERDFSWLDGSVLPILSGDGTLMVFTDVSVFAGGHYALMLRKTDGSPAIRLGAGSARAISMGSSLGHRAGADHARRNGVVYPIGAR